MSPRARQDVSVRVMLERATFFWEVAFQNACLNQIVHRATDLERLPKAPRRGVEIEDHAVRCDHDQMICSDSPMPSSSMVRPNMAGSA